MILANAHACYQQAIINDSSRPIILKTFKPSEYLEMVTFLGETVIIMFKPTLKTLKSSKTIKQYIEKNLCNFWLRYCFVINQQKTISPKSANSIKNLGECNVEVERLLTLHNLWTPRCCPSIQINFITDISQCDIRYFCNGVCAHARCKETAASRSKSLSNKENSLYFNHHAQYLHYHLINMQASAATADEIDRATSGALQQCTIFHMVGDPHNSNNNQHMRSISLRATASLLYLLTTLMAREICNIFVILGFLYKSRPISCSTKLLLFYLVAIVLLPPTTFANTQSSLTDGLVAYYPFNGNADDAAGNHYADVYNAALTADRFGVANSAYSFNGASSYIAIQDGTDFNFVDEFTIAIWVQPGASQVSDSSIITKSHEPGGWTLEQSVTSNNVYFCGIYYLPYASWALSSFGLSANAWQHVAITKQGTNVIMYKNGVSHRIDTATSADISSNGNAPVTIGAFNGGKTSPASSLGRFFSGSIDEVRLYNRTLSASEILQLQLVDEPTIAPTPTPSTTPTLTLTPAPSFASYIDLSDWPVKNATLGFIVAGAFAHDGLGHSVSSAGDVNKDGFADLLIGAPDADPLNRGSYSGVVYLLFGKQGGLGDVDTASATFGGVDGIVVYGSAGCYIGYSLACAGDVNGDGIDDMVMGAPFYDALTPTRSSAGMAVVLFGRTADWANVDLSNFTASSTFGFKIIGEGNGDQLGMSVSGAGDVNGDGYADLIIGAHNADPLSRSDAGVVYVLKGHNHTSFVFANLDLKNSAFLAVHGFQITGANGEKAGRLIAGGVDLNNDSFSDIVVFAEGSKYLYVIFGESSPPSNVDLSDNQAWAFRMFLSAYFLVPGPAGDINSDGIDDLLIGVEGGGYNDRPECGRAYILFGKPHDFNFANIDLLGGWNTDVLGFRVYGAAAGDRLGNAVGGGVDVNADGIDDLVIGAYQANSYEKSDVGIAVVIYGRSGVWGDVDSANLLSSEGFVIFGLSVSDKWGFRVALSCDMNGDGAGEIFISAYYATLNGRTESGGVAVIYGETLPSVAPTTVPTVIPTIQTTASPSTSARPTLSGRHIDIQYDWETNSLLGFQAAGGVAQDRIGSSVSSAGDVNNDGYTDLLVGSRYADPLNRGANSGVVYLLFGKQGGLADVDTASAPFGGVDGIVVYGSAGTWFGRSVSGAGDVNGDGFDDVLIGAPYVGSTYLLRVNNGMAVVLFGKLTGWADIDMDYFTPSYAMGFSVYGKGTADFLGVYVSSAGDINGDGYADIIIGASSAYPNNRIKAGSAYVFCGHNNTSISFVNIDLATHALPSSYGFQIVGAYERDQVGRPVTGGVDLNNDTYSDLVVGSNAGIVYIIFGKDSAFSNVDLLDLHGGLSSLGFLINTPTSMSVSSAGDFNADGIDDLVVGVFEASYSGRSGCGIAYILFGKPEGSLFSNEIDLSSWVPATDGLRIIGSAAGDKLGISVSGGVDINYDGVHDVVVYSSSADPYGRSNAGTAIIVFGKAGIWQDIDAANMAYQVGFKIFGILFEDSITIGWKTVALTGDMNGDGIGEVIVGANLANAHNRTVAGVLTVLYGQIESSTIVPTLVPTFGSTAIPSPVPTSSRPTLSGRYKDLLYDWEPNSSLGFQLSGAQERDQLGHSVCSAGDVNQDGLADILIAAPGSLSLSGVTDSGIVYLFFGKQGGLDDVDTASAQFGGFDGIKIYGSEGSWLGAFAVSAAGDVNGDGIDDIIIGAIYYYTASASGYNGLALIIFGKQSGWNDIDVESFIASSDLGFRIYGADEEYMGYSVSCAGDFNGDGIADVIIGSDYKTHTGRGKSGSAYVFYGRNFSASPIDDFDITTLSLSNGFEIVGPTINENVGTKVIGGLDLNNDSYSDVVVAGLFGYAYVVFGGNILTSTVDLLALSNGSQSWGFRFYVESAITLASAGDINADGLDDLIIGAREFSYEGRTVCGAAFIFFGQKIGHNFTNTNFSNWVTNADGFRVYGGAEGEELGWSVGGGFDINADGIDDIVMGAYNADPYGRTNAGSATVIFGKCGVWQDIDTGNFADDKGFQVFGAVEFINLGMSVALSRDFNGDGIGEIILGASYADAKSRLDAGEVTLIYGQVESPTAIPTAQPSFTSRPSTAVPTAVPTKHPTSIPSPAPPVTSNRPTVLPTAGLRNIDLLYDFYFDSVLGFQVTGAVEEDQLGYTVSNAGDVNEDGFADILVGAQLADPLSRGSSSGIAYVLFGKQGGIADVDTASATFEGVEGIKIFGSASSHFGIKLCGTGDVNGDGIDDIIISGYAHTVLSPTRLGAGMALILFGKRNGWMNIDVTNFTASNSLGFRVFAKSVYDYLGVSVAASDINGDGYSDIMIGAHGSDIPGSNNVGRVYVFYGHNNLSTFKDIDLSTYTFTSSSGFEIVGSVVAGQFGRQMTGGVDLNNDSFGDLIIGSLINHNIKVMFGRSNLNTTINLGKLSTDNQNLGFHISIGSDASLSHGGDINADGIDDLIIGAWEESILERVACGIVYILFGKPFSESFRNINVTSWVSGVDGFRVFGTAAGDQFGSAVYGGVDVNADGVDDLVIGARYADPYGRENAGSATIVFGKSGLWGDIDTANIAPDRGFQIFGAVKSDFLGFSVALSKDMNGDVLGEIILGASGADSVDRSNCGKVIIIYGERESPTALPTYVPSHHPSVLPTAGARFIDLYDFSDNSLLGFQMAGAQVNDRLGVSVNSAGDVNKDGYTDLLMSALYADPLNRGSASGVVYLIFGKQGGLPSVTDIAVTSFGGVDGIQIFGSTLSRLGFSLSRAGDVNGDDIDDIIIGAYYYSATSPLRTQSGMALILFGKLAGWQDIDMDTFIASNNLGFRIIGKSSNDFLGISVSCAGDVNGDGVADVIIGAQGADTSGISNAGISYLLFGRSNLSLSVKDIDLCCDSFFPNLGIEIRGANVNDYTGAVVAGGMNFNNDSYSDVMVVGHSRQYIYVLFGSFSFPANADLINLHSASRSWGFYIHNAFDMTVGSAGDLNADGIDDLIVGSSKDTYNGKLECGIIYVLFGKSQYELFANIELSSLVSGVDGFRVFGTAAGDQFGSAVYGGVDVNADGVDDLVIGARYADPYGRENAGSATIIFGKSGIREDVDTSSIAPDRGFQIFGESTFDYFGGSVTLLKDLNGDGIGEIVVSSASADFYNRTNSGIVTIIFGQTEFPTSMPSSQPSSLPSSLPTTQPSSYPSLQPYAQPSAVPSIQPSDQPSMQPTGQPSIRPSSQPTTQPSSAPSAQPVIAPSGQPSSMPSVQPSCQPSIQPSALPSTRPTSRPSAQPIGSPSAQPSSQPTTQPVSHPSSQPSSAPSAQPVVAPSGQPSSMPSVQPSSQPSIQPSALPSTRPTSRPSAQPIGSPSTKPSSQPTTQPFANPTSQPSSAPSAQPVIAPSGQPSSMPSVQPSSQPSIQPSALPSTRPTSRPSAQPIGSPSAQPSSQPTTQPFANPTSQPSSAPSAQPVIAPSGQPSSMPSVQPSSQPSIQPSALPSTRPTSRPSAQPIGLPSSQPSSLPTTQPVAYPSYQPSSAHSAQPIVTSSLPSLYPSNCPTSSPSYSHAPTLFRERNWTAQILEASFVSCSVIVHDKTIVCGGTLSAFCLRFDNPTGQLSAVTTLPWDQMNAIAVVDENYVVVGQWNGGSQFVIALFNTIENNLHWSFRSPSQLARLQAVTLHKSMQVILAVGNNDKRHVIAAALDKNVGKLVWGFSYEVNGLNAYATSVEALPGSSGSCLVGYVVDKFNGYTISMLLLNIDSYGSFKSIDILGISNGNVQPLGLAMDSFSGDMVIVGKTFKENKVNAVITRISNSGGGVIWSKEFGSIEKDEFQSVFWNNDGLFVIGNSEGFETNKRKVLITFRIDAITGNILNSMRISGPDSILCNSVASFERGLRIACTAEGRATLFFLDRNTLTAGDLPPGYSLYHDIENVMSPSASTGFGILNANSDASKLIKINAKVSVKVTPWLSNAFQSLPEVQVSSTPYTQSWPENLPSAVPTKIPTIRPSPHAPSCNPSVYPSIQSTKKPTTHPSFGPTSKPSSKSPTCYPSYYPTSRPSVSCQPTGQPSSSVPTKTFKPMWTPTNKPTMLPSNSPTHIPTFTPNNIPSSAPTYDSSVEPGTEPIFTSTMHPTTVQSMSPSIYPNQDKTPTTNQNFTDTPTCFPTHALTFAPYINSTVANSAEGNVNESVWYAIGGVLSGGLILLLFFIYLVKRHLEKKEANKVGPQLPPNDIENPPISTTSSVFQELKPNNFIGSTLDDNISFAEPHLTSNVVDNLDDQRSIQRNDKVSVDSDSIDYDISSESESESSIDDNSTSIIMFDRSKQDTDLLHLPSKKDKIVETRTTEVAVFDAVSHAQYNVDSIDNDSVESIKFSDEDSS